MEFNTLLFSIENSIAIITVNRPDKMNALNKDVIADFKLLIKYVFVGI